MPDFECPSLPETWEWWSGNRSATYYTRWFGTEHAENGYEGVIHSDDFQTYSVQIYPILAVREDGELDVSEFPKANKTYNTEAAAVAAVPELIREL
ncbi:hypothetical protein [Halobellus rufus]|uniref:hypothetical protein n=1 Tax=Halobellus rufus TaxID=1448860 RepID=UPI0018CD46A8|nr:hypothetical protein [Halobellus rufus]